MILNFPEIRLIISAGTMLAANRRASSATISREEVEVFMGIVLDGPWPKKNDPERVDIFGGCPVCHENHGHW
jgi:hypothetical protein